LKQSSKKKQNHGCNKKKRDRLPITFKEG